MHFIFDEVDELHHVDAAHRHRLVKGHAAAPVTQDDLAHHWRYQLPFQPYLVNGLVNLRPVELFGGYPHLLQPEAEAGLFGLAGVVVAKNLFTVVALFLKPFLGLIRLKGGVVVGRVKSDGAGLAGQPGPGQGVFDGGIAGAVKDGGEHLHPHHLGGPAQVGLQHLP